MHRNFEAIRDELLALRSQKGFQPLKIPNWASKKNSIASPDGSGSVSHDAGDWNVFYLFLHEVQFPENLARCPVTTKLLKDLGPRGYSHAFFSALTPGTHILKHHGPTNKKLRVHLPLVGAKGSELRVADTILRGEEGKCMVFDDSFEHGTRSRPRSLQPAACNPRTPSLLLPHLWLQTTRRSRRGVAQGRRDSHRARL